MSRKIKFHAFHILFRLFAFLADKSGGWRVFVRPKLLLGSVIVGLGLTACGTKTESKAENKFGFKPTDSIKAVDVNQDTTVLYANKLPELRTTLCYFQTPTIKNENGDTIKTMEDSLGKSNAEIVNKQSTEVSVSCYLMVNVNDIAIDESSMKGNEMKHVYSMVEQMPQFPGGDDELMKFLTKTVHYPVIAEENGIQGKVICGFVVTKTGEIVDVQVLRSLDPSCDKEAIRVTKLLPRFIPGKQNGVNVNVKYSIPIKFKPQ